MQQVQEQEKKHYYNEGVKRAIYAYRLKRKEQGLPAQKPLREMTEEQREARRRYNTEWKRKKYQEKKEALANRELVKPV